MARKGTGNAGVKIKVDTKDIIDFVRTLNKAANTSSISLAKGLNEMGDGLISVIANNLSGRTGLSLAEVRGMIRVKRANRNLLTYEVAVDQRLMTDPASLEGKRESRDFGTRQPGAMVIVVTQKDELVCMDCQELEAAGAMPIEVASAHIPKHPNCRCVIMPYVQKGKRVPLTMTTVTGTSSQRRMRGTRETFDDGITLRQLAQNIMSKSTNSIKLALS